MTSTEDRSRPRVGGERECEILDATVRLLSEVGYDRLTMDAVAAAARAGKATLYRRWTSKADLVVDAVSRSECLPSVEAVDTGSLRTDLLALACGVGGLTDRVPMNVLASLVTALHREPDLADSFQRLFMAPRMARTRAVFERAAARGELAPGCDIELLTQVLPSMATHRLFILARPAEQDFVEHVIDKIVLPACRAENNPERAH